MKCQAPLWTEFLTNAPISGNKSLDQAITLTYL